MRLVMRRGIMVARVNQLGVTEAAIAILRNRDKYTRAA
jgi:hypothetical protein